MSTGGLKDLNLTLADIENELLNRKLDATADLAVAMSHAAAAAQDDDDDYDDDDYDDDDDVEWEDD